jgi:hypothetical protein
MLGRIDDRGVLESFLRQDEALHLYELGDLDDFFFPRTTWYGLYRESTLAAVALVYAGTELPVLVVLHRDVDIARATLEALAGALPPRVYAHQSSCLGRQ